MIKYSLVCDEKHDFESWFRSAADYDEQVLRDLVECPACRSTRIGKAIMAPNVARRDRRNADVKPPNGPDVEERGGQPMVLLDQQSQTLRAAIKELHEKIIETSVDVGNRFADQARRMHEGELPHRAIRGQATAEDARTLWENGVPVMPIPPLPDDQN